MLRKTLLALAVASALVACGKSGPDKGEGPAASSRAEAKKNATLQVAPEDLVTVQTDSLASGPVITGSIEPERKADLRAEVGAVVMQVLKENGEAVRKGDLLVRLDDTSIRDSLTSANEAVRASQQALDQAERMLKRHQTLLASGMTSAQAMEDAQLRFNNAQSDLVAAKARRATAEQQLARTLVRAPFDGIVSDRKVSNGDTAQIGKELIKVIDPNSMRFEGLVSADKIGTVKVGQNVQFRVNGYPGQTFAGKVKRVDPAANPVTRQVEVLVNFADQVQPKVAGLYAEGRVEAEARDTLMIPDSSLVRAGDNAYTWRIKDNVLRKADLVVGARDARTGQWEVSKGLAAGDRVLRAPASSFRDGQKVELVSAKAVASANGSAPAAAKGN
ncbi:efflux RND transporter periplasmic adaptor subunit [Massilia endophytica]|uniref:efflux RND transporter periplasmic adaptor subunit n=1 Tax=Massilia endophytica TaxID=2899220 RepID=UPI001E337762|nr:efflux RND transporter periplasmic adaptor subunit [Massilia endophytica]UGQ47765.1 efflux RND transporter periplasmic adaptor subunit [Massilia endophytica]